MSHINACNIKLGLPIPITFDDCKIRCHFIHVTWTMLESGTLSIDSMKSRSTYFVKNLACSMSMTNYLDRTAKNKYFVMRIQKALDRLIIINPASLTLTPFTTG